MVEICLLLIACHFLFDFPLQGEFISVNKNPTIKNAPFPWYTVLFSHSFLHALPVGLILGPLYGMIELVMHFIIDTFTCDAKAFYQDNHSHLIFNLDQLAHIALKLLYVYSYFHPVAYLQ